MKRLYVGNLSFNSNEGSVRDAFAAYGEVSSVHLVTDRDTGQPRGFGFVEMANASEAQSAIDSLNGAMLDGRYDDSKSGKVKPIDGEAFFESLRQREESLLKKPSPQ